MMKTECGVFSNRGFSPSGQQPREVARACNLLWISAVSVVENVKQWGTGEAEEIVQ